MKIKSLIIACIALICGLSIPSALLAQKPFKGRIVYQMSYPASMVDQLTLSNLPTQTIISARANLTRHEIVTEAFTQIKINDSQARTSVTLMEFGRDRYAVHKNSDQIAAGVKELGQPEIRFTNETKDILGYKCKKALAITTDIFGEEVVKEIFYTEELQGTPFNFDTPYNKIPGVMLEFEMQVRNLNVRYEAKSIRKRSVKAKLFRVPKEYKSITFEELREILL